MVDLPHKIHIPKRPLELISRARLLSALQASIQHKLITLVAPAGYGKTSLLIDLVHSSPIPVCWYTLDSYDADPWTFLGYLAASIERCFVGSMSHTVELIEGQGQPLFRAVVATLIRELSALHSDLIICLDDWHLVEAIDEISVIVTQIVSRCPNSHVILASRSHPSLPNQMLLAARRQFVCIDESQLRFYADELAAVLARDGNADLTPDQAQQLVDQSDGWITGVLLALQTTRGDVPLILANRIAMSRPVQLFLAEQVLDTQPPELQRFLCETAMLEELTADRCSALLGYDDAWRTLEQLLALRIFISEIAPGVVRYHPLFREFLQQRLRLTNASRFQELGLKIANEYARQGNWSMAFDRYTSIDNLPAAQRMLSDGAEKLYRQGRLETLEHIFNALPMEVLDVSLLCLRAKVEMDRGRYAQAQKLIDQAAAHDSAESVAQVTLLQAGLDRIAGHYEQAHDRALQVLEATDVPALQGGALRTLAISQQRLGRPLAALETLQRACAIEQARGDVAAVAQVQHELVVCYHAVGNLRAAEAAALQAEAYWSAIGNLGRRALTRNSLALNQSLSGRYREAHATLCAALRDAQRAATPQYEVAVLSTLGDVYADLERWDLAATIYDVASRIGGTAFIRSHIAVAQVGLLVQQQLYTSATEALARLPEGAAQHHAAAILLLRAQIAGGTGAAAVGMDLARQATERFAASGSLIEQVRAWITQAWLGSLLMPPDDAAILGALERAAPIADQISGDTVAAVASRRMRPTLERLQSLFAPGRNWLDQQDMLCQVAASLDLDALKPLLNHLDHTSLLSHQAVVPAVREEQQLIALRASYLGGDQVWVGEQLLSLGAGRPREVLAYLITHPQGASRIQLYHAIWGEEEPAEGSNALNRVIYRLRAALPEGAITTINRDTYCLDRSLLHLEVDTEAFEQAVDACANEHDQARRMQQIWRALDLYKGPFLRDAEAPWCIGIRARLERRYRLALRQAAESSEKSGAFQKALELFHRIVLLDPTNVAAHAGIMRCHVALGEPGLTIAQYRTLTHVLNQELGTNLDPDSEPERIYRAIVSC